MNTSQPAPTTTEQALRRLECLGCTIGDEPVRRAVGYMQRCLAGEAMIPDPRECRADWDVFVRLMLSAWIRRFTPDCAAANETARQWGRVITAAFAKGEYREEAYIAAHRETFGVKPYAGPGKHPNPGHFYTVSILRDGLEPATADAWLEYLLRRREGIYYVCDGPLDKPPASFACREASRYLGALELLSEYPAARAKLGFAAEWLEANRSDPGAWDMGARVKDGVYFPLSDDWRSASRREADCTARVLRILGRLRAV